MKKLLVTGASGFLGWNLCRIARGQWDVTGVSHTHTAVVDGVTMLPCDLTDFGQLERLFQDVLPDAVIHGAAAADPNFCEVNPELSRRINVDASQRIAQLCAAYDARCAFISTDLIFDGTNPPYTEKSPPAPLSIYGRQKAEAERRMRQAYAAMLICRMPLMFGDACAPAKSFLQPLIQTLCDNGKPKLFIDEFRTPVSAFDAARGIVDLVESHAGILHLGGKVVLSRYEFGLIVCRCLGLDPSTVMAANRMDVAMAAARPADVSLDSSKAFSCGFDPSPPEQALRALSCVQEAAERIRRRK